MKKRVALFEFGVFQGIFPLATGYLEAAAYADPELRDAYDFKKYPFVADSPDVEQTLASVDADVYGFSCYVWNTGLVRRLLPKLLAQRPEAYIVLGGPQVMKRSHIYLDPKHERMLICNGEGERTFPNILRQVRHGQPDFSEVRGVSYYADGELYTTPNEDRINNLEEVPSPYLEGHMEGDSVWAVLETNRGCPFKCTYCYWGAATNAKVHKYSQERIFDEITWCSNNNAFYIFFADANFGMLRRDVEIAKHVAACKEETGFPLSVYFSSSKNTPDRVAEIAVILAEADLVSTQPISLQTMSQDVLASVKRENIKTESYTRLQSVLNERGVSSFLEMIWPLPGETLESFKQGVDELCRARADSYIFYPLMIIGNVELERQRDEFGLVTISDPDVNSEAELVIATNDVTHAEYLDGVRFTYHVTSLYSLRGLWYVAEYLAEEKDISYASVISKFGDYCSTRPDHPYVRFIEDTIAASEQYKYSTVGGILHSILHAHRAEFDGLLTEFLRSAGWLDDDEIKIRLDIDILNRPYVYSNTPVGSKELQLISIVSTTRNAQVIQVPSPDLDLVARLLNVEGGGEGCMKVEYIKTQMPFMTGKSLHDNFSYCQDRLHKMRSLLPTWSHAPSRDR